MATCGTIGLKLLKLGAPLKISARRVKIVFASACPWPKNGASLREGSHAPAASSALRMSLSISESASNPMEWRMRPSLIP